MIPSRLTPACQAMRVGEAALLANPDPGEGAPSQGLIRVLPDALVNQIAAGEVVERPASVVKELVENSIDAGAARIDVAIRSGGAAQICVTDDGSGLSRSDAELAFRRHATSKIVSEADLAAVSTLGFRGEALPSIASVARVRMRTRRQSDAIGVELSGEGNGIDRVREVACPVGTRIEVAELFANVPARLKFMKAQSTESTHVTRWIERMALARPDIRFSLERDRRPVLLLLPTVDARERVIAALPPGVGEHLVEVEGRSEHASLRGFATRPDVARATATDVHVFVNGRPVRDRMLLFAVRDAYRDALPPRRHPAAVLYLTVDPGEVDVNVHPAKWEVRFRDVSEIQRLIRESLHRAIGLQRPVASAPVDPARFASFVRDAALASPASAGFEFAEASDLQTASLVDAAVDRGAAEAADERRPPVAFSDHSVLGQALGTYLVLERPGALVLLDQHAAHERVLFERMRESLLEGKLERQTLLLPIWTELPRSYADSVALALDALARAGFDVEVGDSTASGNVRVGIKSVPTALASRRELDWAGMLRATASELAEPGEHGDSAGIDRALHDVLATASCHTAVRKGDRLEASEISALLRALDETLWVPNCPHGRPIALTLGESWIERRILRR